MFWGLAQQECECLPMATPWVSATMGSFFAGSGTHSLGNLNPKQHGWEDKKDGSNRLKPAIEKKKPNNPATVSSQPLI